MNEITIHGHVGKASTIHHDVVVFGELANNVYDTLMASGGKGLLVTTAAPAPSPSGSRSR